MAAYKSEIQEEFWIANKAESEINHLDKMKVLLIEENPSDALLVKQDLFNIKTIDFDLVHIESFSKGLECLSQKQFDVILIDLLLPERDVIDNLLLLKKSAPRTPIVVLSEVDDGDMALTLIKRGVQDYLIKGNVDSYSLAKSIRYAVERHQMLQQLEKARELELYLSYYDALTGLPNRQLFYDRLQHDLLQSQKSKYILGILLLDLDGFKRINDSLGYGTGDKLLREVSERLKTCVRKNDMIARIGGDEFTIIIDNIKDQQDITIIAQKVLRAISKPFIFNDQEYYITTSIGISLYPTDGKNVEELIKNADVSMYQAKHQGKNNYQFYNLSMNTRALEMLELENNLRKAIQRKQVRLYYQPILDLLSNKIVALEALVRWEHPRYGLVSPEKFISIAEDNGFIVPLGKWIIKTACRHNKALQEAGILPVTVAVNLSARQFSQQDIQDTIIQSLEEYQLDAQYLSLEITEKSVIKGLDYTIKMLKKFQQLGVNTAIDDFGTGYSSLAYLKSLPINMLKIDRSFIKGIPENREDTSIIDAITNLSHTLHLKVVAEGVETTEQIQYLRSIGCDRIQGHYFSKPLTFDDLKKRLINEAKEALPASEASN